MACNCSFGGNCCTWIIILLILWFFCGNGANVLCGNNGNEREYNNGCGCGC